MSDKGSSVPKRIRFGTVFSRIIALIVLIVVVLISVALIAFPDEMNVDAIRRRLTYLSRGGKEGFGSYHYDSHNSNRFAALGDGLAIASVAGINGYDGSGDLMTASQAQLTQPMLMANGEHALAYDVTGRTLVQIHAQRGEVLRIEEPQVLYDADLSASGAMSCASSMTGYKTVLSVYDSSHDLIYRWLSSSTYMPQCAISPDGRYLAAVGLGQAEGVFESRLYLFKTDTESPILDVSLGNDLPHELFFCDADTICVLGESGVRCFNTAGTLLGSCGYAEPYLKDYVTGGDGFLTLLVNMYSAGNRNTLQCVDHTGNQISSLYLGEDVLSIAAAGRYIAVLTNENLTIFDSSLEVYAQTVETGAANAVVMRPDGSALLLGSSEGTLFIP